MQAILTKAYLGAPGGAIPILSFTVPGMTPRRVAAELSRRGICAWDGNGNSSELFDAFGIDGATGAVRLGLVHYNTADEVGYLIDSVAALRPR